MKLSFTLIIMHVMMMMKKKCSNNNCNLLAAAHNNYAPSIQAWFLLLTVGYKITHLQFLALLPRTTTTGKPNQISTRTGAIMIKGVSRTSAPNTVLDVLIAVHTFKGSSTDTLAVRSGEYVALGFQEEDVDGWINVTNVTGVCGFVPISYVEHTMNLQYDVLAKVKFAFHGDPGESQITLSQDELILVSSSTKNCEWIAAKRFQEHSCEEGYAPRSYIEIVADEDSPEGKRCFAKKIGLLGDHVFAAAPGAVIEERSGKGHNLTPLQARHNGLRLRKNRARSVSDMRGSKKPMHRVNGDESTSARKQQRKYGPDLFDSCHTTPLRHNKRTHPMPVRTAYIFGAENIFVERFKTAKEGLSLHGWYTPTENMKVVVVVDREKQKEMLGTIKSVNIDGTYDVQLKQTMMVGKASVSLLQNVSRQDIVPSKWSKVSGNTPPQFLTCMQNGATGSQRCVGTVRDIPFVASLASSAVANGTSPPEFELEQILSTFHYLRFRDLDVIFEEGEEGHSIYIILEGQVGVLSNGRELVRLKSGEWFGEIAVLQWNRRTATCFSVGNTTLLCINKHEFSEIANAFKWLRPAMSSLAAHRTGKLLSRVTFLENLSEDELTLLGGAFVYKGYPDNSVICREGEVGNEFYIIVHGTCRITITNSDGQQEFLRELEAGSWFGEVALIENCYRTATISASSHVTLLVLAAEKFEAFIKRSSQKFVDSLRTNITSTVSQMVTNIPFFKNVSNKEQLASLFHLQQFEEGDVVFREGTKGDAFYILQDGACRVTINNEADVDMLVAQLRTGDFFGEVALLSQSVRTATITCSERTRLLVLPSSSFKSFLAVAPEVKQHLQRHMQRVLQDDKTAGVVKHSRDGPLGIKATFVDIEMLGGLKERSYIQFANSLEWRDAPLLYRLPRGLNSMIDSLPKRILKPNITRFLSSYLDERMYSKMTEKFKNQTITLNIFLPRLKDNFELHSHDLEKNYHFSLSLSIHCTILNAMEELASAMEDTLSTKGAVNLAGYGFKVLGKSNYLIGNGKTLGMYRSVQECQRSEKPLQLVLIQLISISNGEHVSEEANYSGTDLDLLEEEIEFLSNGKAVGNNDLRNKNVTQLRKIRKNASVWTSIVVKPFRKTSVGGLKTTAVQEGEIVLAVFANSTDVREEHGWCGVIQQSVHGLKSGIVPRRIIEPLYETPPIQYDMNRFIQQNKRKKSKILLNRSSVTIGGIIDAPIISHEGSSLGPTALDSSTVESLDAADDYLVDAGIIIPKSEVIRSCVSAPSGKDQYINMLSGKRWIESFEHSSTGILYTKHARQAASLRVKRKSTSQEKTFLHSSSVGRIRGGRIESGSSTISGSCSNADTLRLPYRVRLVEIVNLRALINQAHASVDGYTPGDTFHALGGVVQILVEIVFGGEVLSSNKYEVNCDCVSKRFGVSSNATLHSKWLNFKLPEPYKDETTLTVDDENLRGNFHIENMPLNSKLCFSLFHFPKNCKEPLKAVVLGGTSITVFDFRRVLRDGERKLGIWPLKAADKKIYCKTNPLAQSFLYVRFDKFSRKVRCYLPIRLGCEKRANRNFRHDRSETQREIPKKVLDSFKNTCERLYKAGPSHIFTLAEKVQVWSYRMSLMHKTIALPFVILSVDFTNRGQVQKLYGLLCEWDRLSPVEAMELLDYRFSDYRVRQYAVRVLENLSDSELTELLLQLVQVLKYESFHRSPLSIFLLRRALLNQQEVGHTLFWLLRAEMHDPSCSERYASLMLAYLNNAQNHIPILSLQKDVNTFLENAISKVVQEAQKGKSGNSLRKFAQEELAKINGMLPEKSFLCLGSEWEVGRIIVEDCKVMNSKQKPLWVVFQNGDGHEASEKVYTIFKSGDDLRQDQMTLQILRYMQRLWLNDGIDLRLTPYRCVATGWNVGMLEVVTESNTTANIQKELGSMGALKSSSLFVWLKAQNNGKDNWGEVVDNFVRSCAGYCVASFVLGLGDRHADNIMVKKDGHLFHIDFGHFLGNFKTKLGFKRERTPFVLTPEMAQVMGGEGAEDYNRFVDYCGKAYNILRKHAHSLVVLCRLMIPAGMPELQDAKDIEYMVEMLQLNLKSKDATVFMKKQIARSLADFYRRIDNLLHNIKTGL